MRIARAKPRALEYLTTPYPLQELYFPLRRPMSNSDTFLQTNSTSRKEHPMSFYDATVPAFLQILGSLSGLLTKAEAHCEAKKIQPDVLLGARLYPDMLPLSKQIQLASDFAAKGCARLTHSEVPSTPDTEKTFEELKQRLGESLRDVEGAHPAQADGARGRGA